MAQASGATTTPAKPDGRAFSLFADLLDVFRDPKAIVRLGQRFLTALEADSFETILAAFEADPTGRSLLQARPDSQALLADRADLAARSAESLGRSYLDFLVANGLDAADYIDFAKQGSVDFSADPKRKWLRDRIDCTHDLRHVLTGYGPNPLGEACILTFRIAQVRHPGAAIIAAVASIAAFPRHGPAMFKAISEAFRRGRAALLVDLCPFEFHLSEPLESCRAKLGLTPPKAYQALCPTRPRREPGARQPAKSAV